MTWSALPFLDDQIVTLNTTITERLSALPPTEPVAVPVATDAPAGGRAACRCCSALDL